MRITVIITLILFTFGCSEPETKVSTGESQEKELIKVEDLELPDDGKDHMYAIISTDKGNVIIELAYEVSPLTVANFVALAEGDMPNPYTEPGEPFYDGLVFHRVMRDFMIQGGDPVGTGSGNPGYSFKDEITYLKHDRAGTLSMANSGSPVTNGSQFFITHKPTPWLDGIHSVFGYVVKGQPVVDAIEKGDVIEHIEIVRVGQSANDFNAIEVFEALK
jgi:cyclophilin family peptidyl-prolyl cis-trans isomerase